MGFAMMEVSFFISFECNPSGLNNFSVSIISSSPYTSVRAIVIMSGPVRFSDEVELAYCALDLSISSIL